MEVRINDRTNLTDKQWQIIKKMIPQQKKYRNKFADDASSTPYAMLCEPVVSGEICRMIFPSAVIFLGRFTTVTGLGETMFWLDFANGVATGRCERLGENISKTVT